MRNNSAVLLPNTNPNSLNRPFLKTNIEFNGVNIPVWNIHVEFLYKEDAILHATTVAQHINATKGPLIVMGDFNAEPDTEVLQIFFATGMKSAYGETHNGNHTITWVNFILFSLTLHRDQLVEMKNQKC
jgi:endonuclease/exonuclease/phosphatase family metal-dependent hydrolase